MAVQAWFVPYRLRNPDASSLYADDFIALTRDDESTPKTWGEFAIGRIERLLIPEFWNAWWRLVNQRHELWREESVSA